MSQNQFLQEAQGLIERLGQTIQSEQKAIVQADADAIHAAVVKKNELLSRLSSMGPVLTKALKEADENGEEAGQINSIREHLRICRDTNRENHALANQGQIAVEKSISFLESVMQIGSVRVYDAQGKTGGRPSKRNIGTA